MKILHVINSVDPVGGGPIEGIRQFAVVNTSLGHKIEVASLDSPGDPFLATFPLPVHPLGPGLLKYGYSRRLVPWLRQNADQFDVVIVDGIWQYHSFATWSALRGSDTPYVVFTHGMLDPWFKKRYPLKHLKKCLYWPWGDYRVLRDANAVLFTCEEERALARKSFRRYRCREIVVNFGTAGPKGDPETESQAFDTRYTQLRGKRLAIFLGRLHEKKGCDILIQAFARVLAADPAWHLLMCGPDQVGWQDKLRALAEQLNVSDRITWAGMVTHDLKWGALRASEIFLLPSHQENFGIAVTEALACGLPTLISNKVNIWREIQRHGAGLIAEDDLEGTCTMLKTWLALSDRQRCEMRKHARQCFQQRFEIHKATETLIDVLSSVIGKHGHHANE